jgi:hypothetical protein
MRKGRNPRGSGWSIPGGVVAGALAVGLLIPGRAGTVAAIHPVRDVSQTWITTRGTNAAIDEVDPRIAKEILESRHAVALGGWGGSRTGSSWASYAEFRDDLRRNLVSADLRDAMYDPEKWDATPVNEQRHPVTYARKFSLLARAHGYEVVVTPHPNLVDVKGAACGSEPGESEEHGYVRCGIAARIAPYADVYETKAQALEDRPTEYRAFVEATAAQARTANPNVVVLSGLSTAPGYPATARMLYTARRAR